MSGLISANHGILVHYSRFAGTVTGQDKLFRAIQYSCQLYSSHLHRLKRRHASSASFFVVAEKIREARKLMSLGRGLEHFIAASYITNSEKIRPVLGYLAMAKHAAYGIYSILDIVTGLDILQIKHPLDTKRLRQAAYKAWAVAVIASTISGIYSLCYIQTKEVAASNEEDNQLESKRVQRLTFLQKIGFKKLTSIRTQSTVYLQLASDLCDLALVSSALGWSRLGDVGVGAVGSIGSIASIRRQWVETL